MNTPTLNESFEKLSEMKLSGVILVLIRSSRSLVRRQSVEEEVIEEGRREEEWAEEQ